jgi:hypothetical protein
VTSNNRSGLKGVYYHQGTEKWSAVIPINKKPKYIGLFASKESAHQAYLKALEERDKGLLCR